MKTQTTTKEKKGYGTHVGRDTSGCSVEDLPVLIGKRAYELFEARGRQPGRELEDWLQAEQEINRHYGL